MERKNWKKSLLAAFGFKKQEEEQQVNTSKLEHLMQQMMQGNQGVQEQLLELLKKQQQLQENISKNINTETKTVVVMNNKEIKEEVDPESIFIPEVRDTNLNSNINIGNENVKTTNNLDEASTALKNLKKKKLGEPEA